MHDERQIASDLNRQGHTFRGRPWSRALVRTILSNEKYIGNNVWGRTSFKLKQTHKRNPPEAWIRLDGAFEPLISTETFAAAQTIIEARTFRMSDETMLAKLEQLLRPPAAPGLPGQAKTSPSSASGRYGQGGRFLL